MDYVSILTPYFVIPLDVQDKFSTIHNLNSYTNNYKSPFLVEVGVDVRSDIATSHIPTIVFYFFVCNLEEGGMAPLSSSLPFANAAWIYKQAKGGIQTYEWTTSWPVALCITIVDTIVAFIAC